MANVMSMTRARMPLSRPRAAGLLAVAATLATASTAVAQTVTTPAPEPASAPADVTTPAEPSAPTTGVAAPRTRATQATPTTSAIPVAPSVPATLPARGGLDPKAPTSRRTWSGRVVVPTVARRSPSRSAGVVAKVSPYGPYDNDPQSLLVLESRGVGRDEWYRVLLPERPNGTTGWVRGDALALRATTARLRVSLSARTLTYFVAGRRRATWKVVVGTPTNPTPTGLFAISEVVPQGRANGFFGPFIITVTAHSDKLSDFDGGNGQVAIHGTSLPGLLGQAASHGCVRIANTNIRTIARRVPRGAPVEIVP